MLLPAEITRKKVHAFTLKRSFATRKSLRSIKVAAYLKILAILYMEGKTVFSNCYEYLCEKHSWTSFDTFIPSTVLRQPVLL